MSIRLLIGVWLLATPLFGNKADHLLQFTLDETSAKVATMLGAPAQTGEAGPAHFSWYLQIDNADTHDHSHVLLFRNEDKKLVSITRNFDEPLNIDGLFPAESSRTYYFKSANQPAWPARVRELAGGRILIAMGVAKPGERTNQLMLIRRTALPQYLPWLAEQLADRK